MANFYSNLSHSWITSRTRVLAWYYRQRFGGLPFSGGVCKPKMMPPFGDRSYTLHFEEREDAFQALALFRNSNRWNKIAFPKRPSTILDLGANRGFSSLYWKSRFPEARVVGVEMHSDNVERCRQLFEENGLDHEFHPVAIANKDGNVSFHAHAAHTRHRLETLVNRDDSPADYLPSTSAVNAFSLESFLRNSSLEKVDILKVDIEGSEEFLLETITNWSPFVEWILLEIHHNIDPRKARTQLANAGYEVQIEDERDRTEWWCRRIG